MFRNVFSFTTVSINGAAQRTKGKEMRPTRARDFEPEVFRCLIPAGLKTLIRSGLIRLTDVYTANLKQPQGKTRGERTLSALLPSKPGQGSFQNALLRRLFINLHGCFLTEMPELSQYLGAVLFSFSGHWCLCLSALYPESYRLPRGNPLVALRQQAGESLPLAAATARTLNTNILKIAVH